jgi:hypothetical protein
LTDYFVYDIQLDPGEPGIIRETRLVVQVRDFDLLNVGSGNFSLSRDEVIERRVWRFVQQRLLSIIPELSKKEGHALVEMSAKEADDLMQIDPRRVRMEPEWIAVSPERAEGAYVFISCGQRTAQEIELGEAIGTLVKRTTGWDAYFAQNQNSVDGVTESILRALHKARAFIAVLHRRDQISDGVFRASVWVEQEIAIVAFMKQVMGEAISARAYAHKDIRLEGLRGFILLNAKPFEQNEELLTDLAAWLSSLVQTK